ncbi:MAG: amphi-Trp domain-containing protein [Mariprofundus sp.]|nr:amphi-Trp domain-containing protein [Mariprofundus sp.]
MQREKNIFRHESLQDGKTIRKLLASITDGLGNGKLTFSDGDDQMIMTPEGLLHLKLSASKEEGRNRVSIRLSWQDQTELKAGKKTLKVNGAR